jgi:hypothetical protein
MLYQHWEETYTEHSALIFLLPYTTSYGARPTWWQPGPRRTRTMRLTNCSGVFRMHPRRCHCPHLGRQRASASSTSLTTSCTDMMGFEEDGVIVLGDAYLSSALQIPPFVVGGPPEPGAVAYRWRPDNKGSYSPLKNRATIWEWWWRPYLAALHGQHARRETTSTSTAVTTAQDREEEKFDYSLFLYQRCNDGL